MRIGHTSDLGKVSCRHLLVTYRHRIGAFKARVGSILRYLLAASW
jgi:hypothetical protein